MMSPSPSSRCPWQVPKPGVYPIWLQWIPAKWGIWHLAAFREPISRGPHILWQSQVQVDAGEGVAACPLVWRTQGPPVPQSSGEAASLPNHTTYVHSGGLTQPGVCIYIYIYTRVHVCMCLPVPLRRCVESYNRQSYLYVCIHLCRCSIWPNVPTLHVDRMLDLCALRMQYIYNG